MQKFAKAQIEAHRLQDNFYAVDLGRLHRLHAVRRRALLARCSSQFFPTARRTPPHQRPTCPLYVQHALCEPCSDALLRLVICSDVRGEL